MPKKKTELERERRLRRENSNRGGVGKREAKIQIEDLF